MPIIQKIREYRVLSKIYCAYNIAITNEDSNNMCNAYFHKKCVLLVYIIITLILKSLSKKYLYLKTNRII